MSQSTSRLAARRLPHPATGVEHRQNEPTIGAGRRECVKQHVDLLDRKRPRRGIWALRANSLDHGLHLADVGIRLRELADQLGAIADLINDPKLDHDGQLAYEHGHEGAIEEYESENRRRFRRTLSGLGSYRRNYHYWERVIAEFALTEMNYTQRDTAQLLGV